MNNVTEFPVPPRINCCSCQKDMQEMRMICIPCSNNRTWISVKDRLPESRGFYNIYIKSNQYNGSSSALFEDEKWIDMRCHCCGFMKYLPFNAITHWQPLPESPK